MIVNQEDELNAAEDYDPTIAKLTGDWVTILPKAHSKSVVLGGGKVLYPCDDPEKFAKILRGYILDSCRRSYQAGYKQAKADIRKVIFE